MMVVNVEEEDIVAVVDDVAIIAAAAVFFEIDTLYYVVHIDIAQVQMIEVADGNLYA